MSRQTIQTTHRTNQRKIVRMLKDIRNNDFQESINSLNLFLYKKDEQFLKLQHKKIIKENTYSKEHIEKIIKQHANDGSFYEHKKRNGSFNKNLILIDENQINDFYYYFFHALYPKENKSYLLSKAYNHIFWHELGHAIDEGFNKHNEERLFKKNQESNLWFKHLILNLKENEGKNIKETQLYSSLLDSFDCIGMESGAEVASKIIRLNYGEDKRIIYEGMMENIYEMSLFHQSLEEPGSILDEIGSIQSRPHGSLMDRTINCANKNNKLFMTFSFDHMCYYSLSELIKYQPGYINGLELKEYCANISRVNLGRVFWQLKEILQIWWPRTIQSLKKYYNKTQSSERSKESTKELQNINKTVRGVYGANIGDLSIKEHDIETILSYILRDDPWLKKYQKGGIINGAERKARDEEFCAELRNIFGGDLVLGELQPKHLEIFMTDEERNFLISYSQKIRA